MSGLGRDDLPLRLLQGLFKHADSGDFTKYQLSQKFLDQTEWLLLRGTRPRLNGPN